MSKEAKETKEFGVYYSLEEIFLDYHFVLIDSSLFGHLGSNSLSGGRLARELYGIRRPKQLSRLEEDLRQLNRQWDLFNSLVSRYGNVYFTDGVKKELTALLTHFSEIVQHNKKELDKEASQNIRQFRKKRTRQRRGRSISHYNMEIQKAREASREGTWLEEYNTHKNSVALVEKTAATLQEVLDSVPEYTNESVPVIRTQKTSEVNAQIISTLFAHAKENPDNIGTIITSDGDIQSCFILTLAKLPSTEQRDLAARTSVHFYHQEYQRAGPLYFINNNTAKALFPGEEFVRIPIYQRASIQYSNGFPLLALISKGRSQENVYLVPESIYDTEHRIVKIENGRIRFHDSIVYCHRQWPGRRIVDLYVEKEHVVGLAVSFEEWCEIEARGI